MNMKTRLLGMMAILVSIFAMTACQKDKADDTWKQLPVGQISVESGKATISVNDIPCNYGNVQLVADSDDAATLTLTGVVPGYNDVKVSVDLLKKSDDSFAFKGTTIVSTPPSIAATLRSTDENPCYAFNVDGSITLDGAVKVTVATQVQGDSAPLIGSWNIVRKCRYNGKGVDPNDRSPIQFKWKISDGLGEKLLYNVFLFNHFGNCVLTEVFDQVTFDETGNIMARYWPDLGVDDGLVGAFSLISPPSSDGYYYYKPKNHTDWLESPKANLVFWYATGNSLFVVPNVAAIIEATDSETVRSDASGIDLSSIMEILAQLKEFGVDVDALNAELQKILQRGVELKYSVDGDSLRIYVDKALCDPIVKALLPALPKIDVLLEQLVQAENETARKIKGFMGVLGLEKPSDLATLWNATTEFEIALNFTKA